MKHAVMFRYPRFAIAFTSIYLLVFALFIVPGNNMPFLSGLIFALSPLLLIWMVLSVLKDKSVKVPDLEGDEHWGYQDRPDIRPV